MSDNREDNNKYLLNSLNRGFLDHDSMVLCFEELLSDRLNGKEFHEDGDIWPFEIGDLSKDSKRSHRYVFGWEDALKNGELYECLTNSFSNLCADLIMFRCDKDVGYEVTGFCIEDKYSNLDLIAYYHIIPDIRCGGSAVDGEVIWQNGPVGSELRGELQWIDEWT